MHARDDLHLGVERTDVGQSATVDAHTLREDAPAHDLLRDGLVGGRDHRRDLAAELARGDLLVDRELDALLEGVVLLLALDLVCDLVDADELVVGELRDGVVGGLAVVDEDRVLLDLLGRLRRELLLSLHELRDEGLGGLEALGHDGLVGLHGAALDELPAVLGGLRLDHHDRDVLGAVGLLDDTARDDEVEDRVLELRELRERDPLAALLARGRDEREAHTGDGARERQARDLRRRARGVDREGVVELVGRDAQDGDDDLDLVADAVGERRTQRAVDETAHEDRLGRGAALATEERSGDLAGGVRALLDVDREREEVEAVTRVLRHGGGREEHGVLVEVRRDGALGLLGETTGLETDGAGAELAVVQNGFGELDLGAFHEVLLLAAAIRTATQSEQERAGRARRAQCRAPAAWIWSTVEGLRLRVRRTTTGDQLRAGLLRIEPAARLRSRTAAGWRPEQCYQPRPHGARNPRRAPRQESYGCVPAPHARRAAITPSRSMSE